MFALLDGNNFYVSCERVFRPALIGHPVVVLSNNDGCVISRSEEAKSVGVKMGAPWFQCKTLVQQHGIIALSPNFTLYGDMSNRMMALAADLGPEQEIYSIDECFIGMHGVHGHLVNRAVRVREHILRSTGLPTCIGIGPTKTLAKLANHIAKDAERKPGSYPKKLKQVCNLAALDPDTVAQLLQSTPVQEIWGIGRRISARLKAGGIVNALQLREMDAATVRKIGSVTLEKTVRELRGVPCIELEHAVQKKQIACTRSFGQKVSRLSSLIEAVSEFASRAAEKLRLQRSVAGQVYVFIHTSRHRPGKQCSVGATMPLRPTNSTPAIVQTAVKVLQQLYRPGLAWAKAGVVLLDLQDFAVSQGKFEFDTVPSPAPASKLMLAMDAVNSKFGKGTLAIASTGITEPLHDWGMRQERRTPHYTTNWDEMPVVRAS